jgi:acyl-CoA thioesterase
MPNTFITPIVRYSALFFLLYCLLPAGAFAAPPTPVYSTLLSDCVTGNNQFYAGDKFGWYVNQAAGSDGASGTIACDSYDDDVYERPTDQAMEDRTIVQKPSGSPAAYSAPASPTTTPIFLSGLPVDSEHTTGTVFATKDSLYFEYADITRGRAGFQDVDVSNGWLFFEIELFGNSQVDSTLKREDKFAEGTYYTVRLGTGTGTNKAGNGIILRNQRESNITTTFATTDAKIFKDTSLAAAAQVGGLGGVTNTKDEGDVAGDGYDLDQGNSDWLYVREGTDTFNAVTRPTIEFAFNYKKYNADTTGIDFLPQNLTYVELDSTRGLKGEQNYLWNDEYTANESGSPYGGAPGPPENVYQLDTLRMGGFPQTGSIRIIKDADPNSPQDFEFDVTSAPGGSTVPASFQLDDDGNTDDTDAPGTVNDDDQLTNDRTYANTPVGTYTITEDAVPGWELDSLMCTDTATGGVASTVQGGTATINLDAGETVTCTFQNDQQGSIRIIKDADPNSAQDFEFDVTAQPAATMPASFQLDDDGNTDDTDAPGTANDDDQLTNDRTYSNQAIGSYTITEDPVDGWELDTLVCTDGDQNGTPSTTQGATATIELDPGETVTCTYQNDQLGSIRIVKDADPNSSQDFEFDVTSQPAGGTVPASFQLDDDGNTDDTDAPGTAADDDQLTNDRTYAGQPDGTYTIVEDAVSGWHLDTLSCVTTNQNGAADGSTSVANRSATIELDPGETVTCTFQNDQNGSIRIIKDADSNSSQDFEFDVTSQPAGGTVPASFQLDDDGNTDDTDAPGTAADDDQLTNDRTYANQPDGTYVITEESVSGWALDTLVCTDGKQGGADSTEQGSTATIQLDPGETVTCTFQNDQGAAIRIIKDADPNSSQDFEFDVTAAPGGSTVPASFQLDDDGNTDDSDAPGTAADDDQLTNDRTYTSQPDGTYTITEESVGGWDLDTLVCTDGDPNGTASTTQGATATIELDAGETVTCTFQNDKLGSIRIIKDADPNSSQDFEFDLTAAPGGSTVPASFQLDDDGNTDDSDAPGTAADDDQLTNDRTYTNQPDGTYTIIEESVGGWELDTLVCVTTNQNGAADGSTSVPNRLASIELDPGETVTCTFQNDQLGSIRIVKDADPNSSQDFEFDVTAQPAGGTVPASFQLDDDGNTDDSDAPGTAADDDQLTNDRTYANQPAGTYVIAETALGGWDLGDLVCTDSRSDQGTTASGDQGSTATVELDNGETVTCTFTNVERGEVRIVKDAVPDSAQDFAFTTTSSTSTPLPASFQLDDDGSTDDSDAPGTAADDDQLTNDRTYGDLLAGTYTVTESATDGWTLGDLACTDGDAGGTASSDAGSTATIELDPGETVTCTFRNDENPPPPPPQQDVPPPPVTAQLPSRTGGQGQAPSRQGTPGAARISGPSRCVNGPFVVLIRGRQIRVVTMSVDGRRVRTLRARHAKVKRFTTRRILVNGRVKTVRVAQAQQTFRFRIDPRGLSRNKLHRVSARVRFTTASGTRTRTLRFAFRRCAQAQRPVFTG